MSMVLKTIFSNVALWSFVIAFILSFVSVKGQFNLKNWMQWAMRWYFFWVLGVTGLWGFIAYAFLPKLTAELVGLPQSAFQSQVAMMNLVFCVLGFIAFKYLSRPFQLACLIALLVWFEGGGVIHLIQSYFYNKPTLYNAGSILYSDLILPIIGFLFFWGSKKTNTPKPNFPEEM